MWESNPPEKVLTPQTGFEDRRAHQHPSTPMNFLYIIIYDIVHQYYYIIILKYMRKATLSAYRYYYISLPKIVCSVTSTDVVFIAFSQSSTLASNSSSFERSGYPTGCGIATAAYILLAPTEYDIGHIVQRCTTGIPASSICFTNVAPQRVSVPQVEVSRAA